MINLIYTSGLITVLSVISFNIIFFIESYISSQVGVADFGQYKFVIKAIHFISHIMILGQDYALFYYISRYLKQNLLNDLNGYVRWVFRSLMNRSLVLMALSYLCFHYSYIDNSLMIGVIMIPIICVDTILNKYLLFNKAYLFSFAPRAVIQSLSFTLMILGLSFFNTPLTTINIVVCYGASFVCCCSIYLAMISKFPIPRAKPRQTDRLQWINDGFHFTLSTFVITLSRSIIYFFVQYYALWAPAGSLILSDATLGFYGAITTITFAYHLGTKSMESYLKPRITRHLEMNQLDELQMDLKHVNRFRYLIVWSITLIIVMYPEMILLRFGSIYLTIIPDLVLCTICYHIYTICQPALDYMIFGGQQRIVSRILQVKLVAICLLSYLLIPRIGLTGAVIADAIPAALSALAAALWVWRHSPTRVLAII
tara:strand:- start:14793 stop:16073 length:1281 start_codon:yes stop_codon:yes gene_type:complete